MWLGRCTSLIERLKLGSRDGNGSSFVTHDPCDPSHSWPMTHEPWPLHDFILLMGLVGAWHGGTGQPCRFWEQTKLWIKSKPPAMNIGLIEWVSSFLTSTKNKNCTLLGIYVIIMGQWVKGSDPRPMWPIQKWWPIWPTDPFPSLLGSELKLIVKMTHGPRVIAQS